MRFTRQFRHYLLGRVFTARTDHSSLTWLLKFKDPQGQLVRWIEELSQYHMVVQFRSASKHANADALSRRPDALYPCLSYVAGIKPTYLPCGGCHYRTRVYKQWGSFLRDVDEAVGLSKWQQREDQVNIGTIGEIKLGECTKVGLSDVSFDIVRDKGHSKISACLVTVANENRQQPSCWGFTFKELKEEQA